MDASSVSTREYRRRGRNSNIVEHYPTAESDLRRDRLSELPDSLILEILSLLEMEDVVRTTILSKRWKDLWITVPTLDFGKSCSSFIEGALAKWKGTKILNCRMDFWGDYSCSSDMLDSWLLVPIQKQVEGLYLDVGSQMDEYCPPQRLYSCSSLTDLYLAYCYLEIEQNVQWYKLKSLTIEYPHSLSDDALNRILSGAPLLEELVLWTLNIYESFNIRSSSLKMLEIGNSSNPTSARTVVRAMLRIWAPNLLSLEISGCVYATCLLDVPSLISATLCFEVSCHARCEYMTEEDLPPLEMFDKMFRSISHAEMVTLSSLCIQFLLNIKEDNMITFSNTKILNLYPGSAKEMIDVLEMFPQLMMLGVELHEDFYDIFNSERSEVDVFQSLTSKLTFPGPFLHQLKKVEICWCACDASILSAIEILLQNASVLDKMVFRPKWSRGHRCNRKLWLKAKGKVKSMPRSYPTAKVVVRMSSLEGVRI